MKQKTLTLSADEAKGLSAWLKLEARRMVEQVYQSRDYFDPTLISSLAECLGAGHSVKVSKEE